MRAFLYGLILSLCGCATHSPAQSWDQANLKRDDHGCPTAIFVAPSGNLEQCQEKFGITIGQTVLAPQKYGTIEQAAIAGLKAVAAKPTALYYEWGGLIVKLTDGKFYPLAAETSFGGDHVSLRGDDMLINGTVVGSYHTHPCIPEHFVEYFSPGDLLEGIFFHRTVFMGDFCSGKVHEFKPGDQPDTEHPNGDDRRDIYLTKGRIVGQFTTAHKVTVAE